MKVPSLRFPRFALFGGSSDARAQALVDSFDAPLHAGGTARGSARVIDPFARLTNQQIAHLIDNDWLARRIVRALPEAAWGSELQFADPLQLERWQTMNLSAGSDDGSFLTCAILARAFGKCLLLRGHSHGGDLVQPLAAQPGPIEFLEAISAAQFRVDDNDLNRDPSQPRRFGLPEWYTITGGRFSGQRAHWSRFIEFIGPSATSTDNMRDRRAGVHLSVLDPVYAVLCEYRGGWSAISRLIVQASIPVFKMKGAIKGLHADAPAVLERFQIMADQMTSSKAIVLDADEDESYERKAVSFADLPDMVQQLTIKIAAAANMPLGELFGRIVSGLGDSELGESTKWERQIDSYRTRTLAPRIRQIVGSGDAQFSFAPVIKPDLQAAQARIRGWFDLGAMTDQEVRTIAERSENLEHIENWTAQGLTAVPTESDATALESSGAQEPNEAAGEVRTDSGVKVELAPTTISQLLSLNEARALIGQGPVLGPDGQPDPDGALPIQIYTAKKVAAVEAKATASVGAHVTSTTDPSTTEADTTASDADASA